MFNDQYDSIWKELQAVLEGGNYAGLFQRPQQEQELQGAQGPLQNEQQNGQQGVPQNLAGGIFGDSVFTPEAIAGRPPVWFPGEIMQPGWSMGGYTNDNPNNVGGGAGIAPGANNPANPQNSGDTGIFSSLGNSFQSYMQNRKEGVNKLGTNNQALFGRSQRIPGTTQA